MITKYLFSALLTFQTINAYATKTHQGPFPDIDPDELPIFTGPCPEVAGNPIFNQNGDFYQKEWYVQSESETSIINIDWNVKNATCNRIQYIPVKTGIFFPKQNAWIWNDGMMHTGNDEPGVNDVFWPNLMQGWPNGAIGQLDILHIYLIHKSTSVYFDTDNESFAYIWQCEYWPQDNVHWPIMWIYSNERNQTQEDKDYHKNRAVSLLEEEYHWQYAQEFVDTLVYDIPNGKFCDPLSEQYPDRFEKAVKEYEFNR